MQAWTIGCKTDSTEEPKEGSDRVPSRIVFDSKLFKNFSPIC